MKVKAPNAENLQKSWDDGCSDVRKVLENLYPDFFEKEETYSIGDRVTISGHDCIIATPGFKEVLFILLSDGNRYCDTLRVTDVNAITIKEIKSVIGAPFKRTES